MKKLLLFITGILISISIFSQAPNSFKYQSVIRNASDELLVNISLGVEISILQGSESGNAVYSETHIKSTNSYGLINLEIGNGESNDDFSLIDWSDGPYFIQIGIDVNGGSDYQSMGSSELLSTPYALYSATANNLVGSINENQINDLDHFTNADETDPLFNASIASEITSTEITYWNNKLDEYTESDPEFNVSVASCITSTDTSYWNHKLDSYTETDPLYDASVASGINSTDTAYWNDKLDSYTETDPVFDVSTASGITSIDTTNWNSKLDSSIYSASVASGITSDDTTSWNDKSEFDGDFASLYNAPNIANSTHEKNIQLNTNDGTSSVNITKYNSASVFKVDGTGRITGDGSGLSNVKPLINYTGGDQRYQITANYGSYNNVRSVTITVPSSGVCFVMASGYVDWESTGWDLLLAGILCNQDPNSSWDAEDEWYEYLNIITDYNCPDSSDQYTSFSQHRCIPVSAGTHTFYLWANKHSAAAKTEVADVNISVMFFPTGGTGKAKDAIQKESEPMLTEDKISNRILRSLDGRIISQLEDNKNDYVPSDMEKINTDVTELKAENEALKKRLLEIERLLKEK